MRRLQAEFSVISPMYNVSRYLPEYFASLERQTYGFENLQVILVDDGSVDDTAAVAEAFAARHPNVTVLRKENGGQASARNAALPHATGTWLTFPDPDDVLSDNYFAEVASAVDPENPPSMLSVRMLLWYEDADKIRDTHALTGRFRAGRVTKSLNESPSWVQPHITSGFMRREVVIDEGLTFHTDLRLRFEDGSFASRYLLRFAEPTVTFIPEASYLYRQRSDNSSTVQSSSADPRKYTDTIRYGYLPVIDDALEHRGEVPRWLQNLCLYDQFWILRSSQTPGVRNAPFPEGMYAELHELLPAFLQHMDDEAIAQFDLMYVAPWMREALTLTKRGEGYAPVYWGGVRDPRRGLRTVVFRYRGSVPHIGLKVNGVGATPLAQKSFGLEYVGRPILMQHVLWVPDDASIELFLDGVRQEILERPPLVPSAYAVLSQDTRVSQLLVRSKHVLVRGRDAVARRLRPGGLHYLRRDHAVRSQRLAQKFAHAWVFIDRDVDAGDSAEDMYWWMAEHHPEHNSWFVVREGTPDWERMSTAGARLVGYETPEFYSLLKHADHLASSHADRFITHALPIKMRPPKYAFTFLQHGVIKGDISHWLNPKDIQVFVASTLDEYRYLTEAPAYRASRKEVRLTGLPRFDVLLQRAESVAASEKNLIVVMPTWRDYLVGGMGAHSADREAMADFAETEYAKRIAALLSDERLLTAVRSAGARIVFMPHPNMRPYLSSFSLPDEIEVRSYADTDVREMIVRARLLITDYSSIAFNAAYIRTPVLYYQHDRDQYFVGHTERPGYFDYHRDGFGPVVEDADEAVRVAASIVADGPDPAHLERMDRTFPVRDGRNRERVYEAMLEAQTFRPLADRLKALPADNWDAELSADSTTAVDR
ncbi:CDP-glycerol glycerophosphotransferase family protein [Microbacterium sp.]|uniref:bifunctional glycosyltransferase/CDP-glycerol:glycerophosphate glycerophosphotransferase n=1 Tax=Microbacterium sp. TaxID=51671 RepID=UPI0028116DD2|nr:CDP-glycerol glycerophosphotransferase family protein [Microbacterium sp.]